MCPQGGSKKPAHIRHVGGDVHEFREEHLEEQLPYERRTSLPVFRLVRALEWFVPFFEKRPTQSTAASRSTGSKGGWQSVPWLRLFSVSQTGCRLWGAPWAGMR